MITAFAWWLCGLGCGSVLAGTIAVMYAKWPQPGVPGELGPDDTTNPIEVDKP